MTDHHIDNTGISNRLKNIEVAVDKLRGELQQRDGERRRRGIAAFWLHLIITVSLAVLTGIVLGVRALSLIAAHKTATAASVTAAAATAAGLVLLPALHDGPDRHHGALPGVPAPVPSTRPSPKPRQPRMSPPSSTPPAASEVPPAPTLAPSSMEEMAPTTPSASAPASASPPAVSPPNSPPMVSMSPHRRARCLASLGVGDLRIGVDCGSTPLAASIYWRMPSHARALLAAKRGTPIVHPPDKT